MALLRVLLLACALVALPTFASIAGAAPVATIAQSSADLCDSIDTGDEQGDDLSADDLSTDDLATDDTETRAVEGQDTTDTQDDPGADDQGDDPAADDQGDDPAADDQGDDPSADDEPSDDELCAALDDSAYDPAPEDDTPDPAGLQTKGLKASLTVPGPGTVDASLTDDGSTGARIAAVRVLGQAHKSVAKAGTVNLRVKLTKAGKRLVRTAKRTLRLTLHTRIKLASGRTVDTSAPVTVKPAPKPKHRKPQPRRPKRHR